MTILDLIIFMAVAGTGCLVVGYVICWIIEWIDKKGY